MPPGDVAPVFITTMLALATAAVLIFRGPIGKAIARRLEGPAGQAGGELAQRVADLEHRLAEVEHDRARVAELEERLDFAERLLSGPKAGSGA